MSKASEIMKELNPNALIGIESDGRICMVEHVIDPDGRMFSIEIQATPDGKKAIGFCRYNPWGKNPYSYIESHLHEDEFLCLGNDVHKDLYSSPMDVETAILRARYWCTAFSRLMESGEFPDP
ncbi:MAG: hypothetical protein K8T10_15825 [Candidatus Eremiobacteraeota bacterium]|nr:hypothetical protein [Candidatus Eremiobacteraeota bacterium]